MGVGDGLYMYVVVVQKFTFAISSPDEFLYKRSRSPYNWQTLNFTASDFSDRAILHLGIQIN